MIEHAGTPQLVRCAALGVTPAVAAQGSGVSSPGAGVIENSWLRVEVGADGSFEIVNRVSGARTGRLNELEDEGDRGDACSFEFAGPLVVARGLRGTVATAVRGDRATVRASFEWPLPAALRGDRLARLPALVSCPVTVTVSLDAEARHVDVALNVDNRVRDHRLRAVCRTDARTATHVAGAPFELADRTNGVPAGRG